MKKALLKGTASRTFVPVLCGSATQNIGVDLLCNFIVDAMPSPLNVAPKLALEEGTDKEVEILPNSDDPFLGLVFKTIADPLPAGSP
ncbi:MAG: hypothetical protein R2874_04085 [Desulfobacterales bacterium]